MQITFKPFTINEQELLSPEPAIKHLPDWYRNMKPYTHGKKDIIYPDGTINLNIKRCNPVGDSLGAGYFIFLENSISVQKDSKSGETIMQWARGGEDLITTHGEKQIDKKLVPPGFDAKAWKFKNYWSIQTPKNYSVLITHPLNRSELPFFTLSGVVDTDTYHTAVNFPFFLQKDFEGMIEASTPIAQVIPFKREKWSSFVAPFDKYFFDKTLQKQDRFKIKYYKKFHWQRKEWG